MTHPSRQHGLEHYERAVHALLDAYHTGTPEAMERHYALTWHRRAWPAMRTYVQLDLGKRPASPDDPLPITMDDARYLVATEHGFAGWDDLVQFAARVASGVPLAHKPVRATAGDRHVVTREWGALCEFVAAHDDVSIEAHGEMSDDVLRMLSDMPGITALHLEGSKAVTDEGARHLARMPQLRVLDIGGTAITDESLAVLGHLPTLETLRLVFTRITDAGVAHLASCAQLRALDLMWTRTGDGAIRALEGLEHLHQLASGNLVSNAGIRLLHGVPALAQWRGGEVRLGLLAETLVPTRLSLRGTFDDAGMQHLRGLDGLFALDIDDASLSLTRGALEPLAELPHLGSLACDAKDDWMPIIARMPVLRSLTVQDTTAGDEGFEALSRSQSIEFIWGRRCHNLKSRGFMALGNMPSLRGLSVSCLNVDDDAIAVLPDFPALRELMPMDVPDAGYRHIGRCAELRALLLMYCRETTDAATEYITALAKLERYFNSYTEITDRTPELLSRMDSLERITFDACHNLTDTGVATLARLPRLKELRVAGRSVTPAVAAMFPPGVTVHVGG